jgi:hypothetical protein
MNTDKLDYKQGFQDGLFEHTRQPNQSFMYYAGFDDGVIALECDRENEPC